MYRLALLSMHGCPVARPGERDAGGMNVYLLQIAKELGKLGNKVDVFTRVHDPDEPQVVQLGPNARVVHLMAGPYDETKNGLYRYIPEFLNNLYAFQYSEGSNYDLIHSHYWLSGWAATSLSKEWGVPHVTTFHTLAKTKIQARFGENESKRRIAVESSVTTSADAILVSTDQERDDLFRLYHVPPHKVKVVPPGVDLGLFHPLDKVKARQALGLSYKNIVLSVGRVEPLKGLDLLIGAMAMLDNLHDTGLVIVGGRQGSDREMNRLSAMASALKVDDHVTFVGTVDQAELPAYYSAADVFVLPSYYESFGMVTLEAMACGTPIIASRVGGPKTFVTGGVTGYLIEWHCPEPYAQRLDILLSNPSLQVNMGVAARARVQSMGWDSTASSMLRLYSSMIKM